MRCYNGITGATTNGCGFTANWIFKGGTGDDEGNNSESVINFGFNIEDRFIVASPLEWRGIDRTKVFHLRTVSGNQVTLLNWVCNAAHDCVYHVGDPFFGTGWRLPMPFYVVVY